MVPSVSSMPGWSMSSKTVGPILVKFSSTEWNADASPPRYLAVYVEVMSILVIHERKNGGTRIILKGDIPVDLSERCDLVIKKLERVMEEASG